MDRIVRILSPVLLVMVAACAGQQPSAPTVSIPTSSWSPGDAGMASLIEGTLTSDSRGCLVVDDVVLVWPKGYTARTSSQGTIEVLDPAGTVVARTGVTISAGGGRSLVGASGPCVEARDSDSVFQVNAELPALA